MLGGDWSELISVELKAPPKRVLVKDPESYDHEIKVKNGILVTVSVRGDKSKPALLTYHDLGLNASANFGGCFNHPEFGELATEFCVYHVNAPGQEEGAEKFGPPYPSMDDLADQINDILNHFAVVRYVGVGVGLGANVLVRHALGFPERVVSLMLVNTVISAPGWFEWGCQKVNIYQLSVSGMTKSVLDYLLWHHFGEETSTSHDLVNTYRQYFQDRVNPGNLAKLIDQYIRRKDIQMDRLSKNNLKVPVLNLAGGMSPFVKDTVALNGCLEPANTNWLKIHDACMVLEETPAKVVEAFRLFLNGQGYCLNLTRKINKERTREASSI